MARRRTQRCRKRVGWIRRALARRGVDAARLGEAFMLTQGPAKKVTVYVGDGAHHHGEPLYLAVLNYLFYHGVSGATVTKGVAGFGADHHMHTARILELSESLPIKIEFVETPATLDKLLPKLLQMVDEGLVEVQDTTILKAATSRAPEPV